MTEEVNEMQEAVQNMQAELHEKGALLSKVWSDLFSLFTKYQAEILVKENSISVAERQLEYQKAQIDEMKSSLAGGEGKSSEELSKLQDELNSKELEISKFRIELTTTNSLLKRVQGDLASRQTMLEKSQTECLEKQNQLVRLQMDNEKFKMELNAKDEQILMKDRLLLKIQEEMRRESDEFKDRVRQLEEVLDAERKAHAATRRRLNSKAASSRSQVIEIADSPPPTLDMSVEQQDVAISGIMSLADSQGNDSFTASSLSKTSSMSLNSSSLQQVVSHSPHPKPTRTSTVTLQNRNLLDDSAESESWKITSCALDSTMSTSTNSDSFPQLSQIDTSQMKLGDVEMEPSDSSLTQAADTNSSPVPISGPIPSGSLPDMSQPGMSGEVKDESSAEYGGALGDLEVESVYFPLATDAGASLEESAGIMYDVSESSAHQGLRAGSDEALLTEKTPSFDGRRLNKEKWLADLHREIPPETRKCKHCQKVFKTYHGLLHHIQGHHRPSPKGEGYTCHYCQRWFARHDHCVDHERCHTGEKPFPCDSCDRKFKRKSALNHHKKTCKGVCVKETKKPPPSCSVLPAMPRKGKRLYQCSYCHKKFPRQDHLVDHIRTHTGEKPFACDHCGKMFKRKSAVNDHIRNIHKLSTSGRNFVCAYCGEVFLLTSRLQEHVLKMHRDNLIDNEAFQHYQCAQCSATFLDADSLEEHFPLCNVTESINPDLDLLEQCEIEEENSPMAMWDEMAHSGTEVYVDFMDRLVNTDNVLTEEASFRCVECDTTFPDFHRLKYHIRRDCQSKVKPYKCQHCFTRFTQKGNLNLHMKRHTSSGLKCNTCGKVFYRQSHLTDHIRMHTGEKPFGCPHCNKAFINKGPLNHHIRRHHPEKWDFILGKEKNY